MHFGGCQPHDCFTIHLYWVLTHNWHYCNRNSTKMTVSQVLHTECFHDTSVSHMNCQEQKLIQHDLTHWGRVTHICVSNLTIIGSDNGLSPGRQQAITWTNVGILFIGPLGTNFSEILIGIWTFSFRKIHLKMASAEWHPFCLSLNVLTTTHTHKSEKMGSTSACNHSSLYYKTALKMDLYMKYYGL